jgi:hypothetical protein
MLRAIALALRVGLALRAAVPQLGPVFFAGLGFVTFYRFLKIPDTFSYAFSHFRQFLASKKEQDKNGDDQKFRYA